MPLICADITIPPNTPQTSPTRVPVKVPAGVIRKVWVENITSTSFDIVTDTAPTADLNVSWQAEV